MTRVASFSHNQTLISGILRNQADVFTAQQQVTTGKRSDDYKGIAQDTSTLVSAQSLKSQASTFIRTGERVKQRLETNDIQLSAVIDTARDLKQTITQALANDSGAGLDEAARSSFNLIGASLNTSVGGSYLFAGSRIATKPFTPNTLDDLAALPSAGAAFANDNLKATASVTEHLDIEYGVVASDVAEPLTDWLRNYAQFNAGPNGNISGPLTPAQRTYLEGQLGALESAIQHSQSYQVSNGLKQSQVDQVSAQLQTRATFLETFVSDIEDVNVAEAISRLQNDQTALQASYQAYSKLSDLSLTRYL